MNRKRPIKPDVGKKASGRSDGGSSLLSRQNVAPRRGRDGSGRNRYLRDAEGGGGSGLGDLLSRGGRGVVLGVVGLAGLVSAGVVWLGDAVWRGVQALLMFSPPPSPEEGEEIADAPVEERADPDFGVASPAASDERVQPSFDLPDAEEVERLEPDWDEDSVEPWDAEEEPDALIQQAEARKIQELAEAPPDSIEDQAAALRDLAAPPPESEDDP